MTEAPVTPRERVAAALTAHVHRQRGSTEPFPGDATLATLGLDSADVLEMVAEVEDALDVAVPLDALVTVRRFDEMVECITGLVR